MAAVPMLAGVGLMMVCCSSLSAFMMMGGEEETPTSSTTPAGPSAGPSTQLRDCESINDINTAMRSQRLTQEEAEKSVGCEVPENLQSSVAEITYCDVSKTDWINNKMQNDGMAQTQGESLQNCKVPTNLQARITN